MIPATRGSLKLWPPPTSSGVTLTAPQLSRYHSKDANRDGGDFPRGPRAHRAHNCAQGRPVNAKGLARSRSALLLTLGRTGEGRVTATKVSRVFAKPVRDVGKHYNTMVSEKKSET